MTEASLTIEQHGLAMELAQIRTMLQRYAGSIGVVLESLTDAELGDSDAPFPELDQLCTAFNLSPFERATLLLCAGVELDGQIAALCTALSGDRRRIAPTFRIALAALPDAHWSALSPDSPLRRWHLLELGQGEALVHCPLRIDERVLHHLLGVPSLDTRLRGLVTPVEPDVHMRPRLADLATQIAHTLTGWSHGRLPIIQLNSSDRTTRRIVAAACCAQLGLTLWRLDAAHLPSVPAELEMLERLWEREAALASAALLIECDQLGEGDPTKALVHTCDTLGGIVFLSVADHAPACERPTLIFDLPPAQANERLVLWQAALGPAAAQLNGSLDRLVAQFALEGAAIQSAGRAALRTVGQSAADKNALEQSLWESCRRQARPQIGALAERIESRVSWQDLVLPAEQQQLLHTIVAHVRQRTRVYEDWGFGSRSGRGLGISALFAGPSGTGKTLAAEVIANELHLDLYKIDLSQVVNKYIGETEKNLRRIFDAAESGGAILLFDEADALFGKRSEVKESHDRHANIEVSYLLQRMEQYRGLAILTTNMKHALDPAFLRRMRFVVQFPFPDATQRAAIWRQIFPAQTPTEGLDVEKLARLSVAGGNIRNIALGAAFVAADAGQLVQMQHLLEAAQTEYSKLEKALTDGETMGW